MYTILEVYVNHLEKCVHLNVLELQYIIKSREQMYHHEYLIFTQRQLIVPEGPGYTLKKKNLT